MRKELEHIGSTQRHTYRGTFVRFGMKSTWGGEAPTILLKDVVEQKTGKKVADRLWFNKKLTEESCGFNRGRKRAFVLVYALRCLSKLPILSYCI